VEEYYNGFCNRTVWPLFNYFPQYSVYKDSFWEAYKRVNRTFSEALTKIAKDEDTIWIHDYHLMLLPKLVGERLPNAAIGFFLHIPFPSFEVFRLLPKRKEILEGILGADLIGFHTYDYARHFLDSVHCVLGYEHNLGRITAGNRALKVDAFPMGIDYKKYSSTASDKRIRKRRNEIQKKLGERKIILSIDRLDYTKGIPQRLEVFDLFLEKNPEYRGKVALVLIAVPSRGEVEHYKLLKRQIDELVGKINGKYGSIAWMPISYQSRAVPFDSLIALYTIADTALITPLRDGMNLIAQEYVATKTEGKGVLILSEMAGAAKVLGEATIVNPNDVRGVAEAIKEALSLPDEEKVRRMRAMQSRLQRYDVVRWATDFLDALATVKKAQFQLRTRRLTGEGKTKMINVYSKSSARLILLDYDGTLVPFADTQEEARPDRGLLRLLDALALEPRNEVVIISGRPKEVLEEWFAERAVGLVAEHGAWIKEKGKEWSPIQPLQNGWKKEIRPILELYADRTPGSFVEEKSSSLVWHYRKADPELGSVRAKELSDTLSHFAADTDLGVLEGNKVIEIKNASINKGRVALKWTPKKRWEFILAIGDDTTDEDLFAALPKSGFTVKVGIGASRAAYYLDSPTEIRRLLDELVGHDTHSSGAR